MFSKAIRFVFFTLALAVSAGLLIGGCAKKDKVVAKVGKYKITASQFKEAFIARYRTEQNAEQQSFKDRMDFLNSMIDQKLILADAYNKGLDKKQEILEAKKAAQERVAVQQILYEREIVDKIISEAEIKDYYNHTGEELKARHILVRIENASDTASVKAAEEKADSIYQAIVSGSDFAELAKQFSDDKSNSGSGGDLGYFQWGRMVDEFQQAAFKMKVGELSKPVRTVYGFHIIELLDRRAVERKNYEEEKAGIKENLRRLKMQQLREEANKYIEELKTAKGLKVYMDSLNVVFSKITVPTDPQNISLFSNFTEAERNMVVAEWGKGRVTVADLDEKIGGRGAGAFTSAEDFKQVIDGIVVPEMLTDRAKERKLYDDPQALKAATEAMEAQMLREARKVEIDDKINFDDASLQKYYNEHLDKYMSEPQVTICEIFMEDRALAEKLLKQGQSGANFKKLAKKHTTRANAKATEGILGPFGKNRYGRIGREAFRLEKGEFCKTPIRMGNKYSIFRVEDKIPAQQKTFEESKREIERDYRMDMQKQLEEEWLKRARGEISVKIYEDNLRGVLPFTQAVSPMKDKSGLKEGAKPEDEGKAIRMTEPKPLSKEPVKKK